MKLSKLQSQVIKRLQEGWELGLMWSHIGYTRIKYHAWLQKNGLGKCGLVEDVDMRTFNSLRYKNLIKRIPGLSNVTQYILNNEGEL